MSYPQPIGDLIPQIIAKMGLTQRVKEAEAIRDWKGVVGEVIAKHCKPVALEKGYLTVNVDSSPWLNELQRFSKPLILQKLQDKLGKSIRDIKFRIGEVE
jgi:predicted nucleic acid-binding Zn ribbon protein